MGCYLGHICLSYPEPAPTIKRSATTIYHVSSSCLLSISCNLVDKATSWSDTGNSIIFLACHDFLVIDLFPLVLLPAPCLSNWGIFKNVRYGSNMRNVSAFFESFFVHYRTRMPYEPFREISITQVWYCSFHESSEEWRIMFLLKTGIIY